MLIGEEHARPSAYYSDPEWRSLTVPVVPPTRIQEQIRETGQPAEWNNTLRYGNCACCEWPMRYLSELVDGEIVTRLLPGSVMPIAKGWIRRHP